MERGETIESLDTQCVCVCVVLDVKIINTIVN